MKQLVSLLPRARTLLTMTFFVSGCEKARLESDQGTGNSIVPIVSNGAEQGNAIPVKTILTNSSGKKLEATIIGRDPEFITVIRAIDGDQFQIPLSTLSPESQGFVKRLPLILPPEAPLTANTKDPKSLDRESGVLVFRRARLTEVDQLIIENERIALLQEAGSIKHRSLVKKGTALRSERHSLQIEIADLEQRRH